MGYAANEQLAKRLFELEHYIYTHEYEFINEVICQPNIVEITEVFFSSQTVKVILVIDSDLAGPNMVSDSISLDKLFKWLESRRLLDFTNGEIPQ